MKNFSVLFEFTLTLSFFASALCEAKINVIPSDESARVLGGIPAKDAQFPYMVALYWNDDFMCTATLVSPNTVLTAAHCVTDKNGAILRAWSFHAFVGSIHRNGTGGSKIFFSGVESHPEYDASKLQNDIAILKTYFPVYFTRKIQPICLHSATSDLKSTATVVGWGWYKRLRSESEILRYNDGQKILRDSSCRFLNPLSQIDSRLQLCASGNGKGPCKGDSGGPLLCYDTADNPVECGIVSSGKPFVCDLPLVAPIIYTRVSAFTEWVINASGDENICTV